MNATRYKTLKQVVKEAIRDKITNPNNRAKLIIRGDIRVVPYSDIVLINPGTYLERPVRFDSIPEVSRELRELKNYEIRVTELSA